VTGVQTCALPISSGNTYSQSGGTVDTSTVSGQTIISYTSTSTELQVQFIIALPFPSTETSVITGKSGLSLSDKIALSIEDCEKARKEKQAPEKEDEE
jgi:hypothetical protein